jgi:hypothetical protein
VLFKTANTFFGLRVPEDRGAVIVGVVAQDDAEPGRFGARAEIQGGTKTVRGMRECNRRHDKPIEVMLWLARMTWRETMILIAISASLSAAITAGIRLVMENPTF